MATTAAALLLLLLPDASALTCDSPELAGAVYCNHSLPIAARVEALVGQLTMAEKTAKVLESGGSVPRLGIPTLGSTECLRGYLSMFPQALTMSQAWNISLIHAVASATGDEVRASANEGSNGGNLSSGNAGGSLACFDPVLNVCRDPRWGRCQEGYGEDPWLTALLGEQYVSGLQYGDDPNHLKVLAGCKHFDVHTGPENNNVGWTTGPLGTPSHVAANQTCAQPGMLPNDGHGVYVGPNGGPGNFIQNDTGGCRWSFDARVSAQDWIETFQLPFKKCVAAGARSLMCSYNKVNGVPSCANPKLLTDLLRGEWGFKGYIVSDCIAIQQVHTTHFFANSLEEAAALSLEAGTDWDLCGGFTPYLTNAVEMGLLSEARVDVAVRRVLTSRFELGDFDLKENVPYRLINASVADTHHELAREAARQGIVMLENRNGVLPLSADALKGKKVALVGPCANNTNCHTGDYTPKNDGPIVTPLMALQERLGAANVLYAPGCPGDIGCNGGPCPVSCRCVNTSHFPAAVAAAKAADVVIFVGGASALAEWMEGEAADKTDLLWPGQQEPLAKAVKTAAGAKPFIVAMAHGSPLVSGWAFQTADAVLNIGYGGQAAGYGLVDVLLNEPEGPSGKLTITYYKPEQLGSIVDYGMRASYGPTGKTYKYLTAEPYYDFGFGLSYTNFTYSDLIISPEKVADPCAEVVVTVFVTNSGAKHSGAEIAQIYIQPEAAEATTKPKLIAFGKTPLLAPGASAPLSFIVTAEHRSVVVDYDHTQAVEPGRWKLAVGGAQPGQGQTLRGMISNDGKGPLKKCVPL